MAGNVYVTNVVGGYKVWCSVCGASENITPGPRGMPINEFVKRMDAIESKHKGCVAIVGGQRSDEDGEAHSLREVDSSLGEEVGSRRSMAGFETRGNEAR